jgi:hypothetical protein
VPEKRCVPVSRLNAAIAQEQAAFPVVARHKTLETQKDIVEQNLPPILPKPICQAHSEILTAIV